MSAREELIERARAHGWYHTLELAPGLATPGMFDHRPFVQRYGLPERLDGLRCLDVGTWDGFWAFELERRGAAEVHAIDLDDERELDWPANRRPQAFPERRRGEGFEIARELLGSRVERHVVSVYDAQPEDLGTFDLVFCGSVIMHLRDQALALERIAGLCSGTFISAEEYDPWLSRIPLAASRYLAWRDSAVIFWLPNVRAWRQMLHTAGFPAVREHGRFKLKAREGWSVPHVVHHASKAAP